MPIPEFPALPDFATHQTLYLAFGAVVLLFVLAQRIPIIRSLVNLGLTIGLVAMVFMLLNQRSQFDPYLGRIARFLKIDDQQVVGGEVRIRMAPDGHFWARARIDGVERRMLIDSGATITALSTRTAADAGISVEDSVFPVVLQTANGAIPARTGKVADLRLGAISARGLQVVVSPAFGDTNVLGMNFLSRLASWRVEGNMLILVPHHPQKTDAPQPFVLSEVEAP